MGKFCTECGKGIDDNQDVCIHCGTSLNVNVEQEDIDEHVSHESDSSYSNQVAASKTGVNDDENQTSVNEVEFNDDENQVIEDETEVNNGGKQVIESENNQ